MTTSVDRISPPTASPRQDSLGCTLAGFAENREFAVPGLTLYRKRHSGTELGRVATPPSDRGLLIGVALEGGHRRRIFRARASTLHGFAADSIYIRSFGDSYAADMENGFDFLLLEISEAAMQQGCAETGLARSEGLACTPGERDPVLPHLARALLPVLAAPAEGCALFVDQVALAIQSHIARRYHGGTPRPSRIRGLSRAQEALAKELLVAQLDGGVLIGDVAAACRLSRSHFIRAFRQTTGQTPYQWLLAQRVERARQLLRDPRMPLAEVAVACGFADQSHFTRIFSRQMGMAPGSWRRRQ
ncbi:helix-turn-helix transcriptional regulator [Siccirubricoccus phaeus]|uniref:helix-turn-helix transcriptional regulator n=1 Tax=Siccirubricoccus phaeus TaxID=2595053 RepID=UPI0011F0D73E|nr:helix-turn-helix domain-containing protein [Siccirubricoccus phaeus]